MSHVAFAPSARLVLPRRLLLKAAHHHEGMYSKSAGYYLLAGRWHKLKTGEKAPKGAPVAAHPQAAGQHLPAAHFTDDQWAALKLPDSNVNAPSYNKALDKLKEWSDAGNVTAIVGAGYGSNTYGQKLAKVANHLLGLHGSAHKVAAGQKSGEHAAVQSGPAEPHPSGLPEHLAPKTTQGLQEPGGMSPLAQHVKDSLDQKAADGDVEFIKLVAANNPEHPQIVAYAQQKLAELQGKAPSPVAAQTLAQKIEAAGFKAHVNEQGKAFIGSKNFDAPKVFISPEKAKEAIVKLKDAGLHAHQSGAMVVIEAAPAAAAAPASAPVGPEITSSKNFSVGGVDFVAVKKENVKGSYWIPAVEETGQEIDHQSYGSIKKMWDDLAHVAKITGDKFAQSLGVKAPDPSPEPATSGPLTMPAFDEGKTTTGVKAYYEKVAKKVIDHGLAGNVAVLEGMKDVNGKSWQGKTANSKKLLALHKQALAYANGGAAPAVDTGPKEGDTKPAADGGLLVLKDGHWVKQGGDEPAAVKPEHFEVSPGDVFKLDSQYQKMNAGEWVVYNISADGAQVYMHKVGAKVPNATNSATIPATTLAEAVAKGTAKKQTAPPAPASAPANGALTPQQLSNLQSIPWVKLKLPAENTNAKSHNAAVAKIEAMAFAGDTAGLQAFIDAKAGAKQTYAKKQVLTAQTALAGLQQPGATAAVPVEPAPAKPSAPLLSGVSAATAIASFKAVSPNASLADFEAKWKEANAGKVGLNVEWAMAANPAPAAAPPAAPKTATAPKTILHNTMPGHSKSWSVYVAPSASGGFDMVTEYGKIGGTQQKTVKSYATAGEANTAAIALKNEKFKKGYVQQPTDFGHVVPAPGAAAKPAGPKEGDTKQGADGLLVLKNGHWVKMNPDADAGGWDFTASNPGLSGEPSLEFEKDGMAYYVAGSSASGYEFGAMNSEDVGVAEPAHSFVGTTLAEAVEQAKAAGLPVPPEAALKKLDPAYKPAVKDGQWNWSPADPSEKGSLPSVAATINGKKVVVYYDPLEGYMAHATGMPGMVADGLDDPEDVVAAIKKKFGTTSGLTVGHVAALEHSPNDDPFAGPAAAQPSSVGADGIPSMDAWTKIGEQAGSNPGGKFRDPSGQEWYCKWPSDPDAIASEVLAAKLYALAGLSSQDCMVVTRGGKPAIATKWVNIKKAGTAAALAKTPGALDGFAVDAWLGNWDVVGQTLDNLQVGPDGKAHRVDAGGSLEYRAQGAKKPFGASADEIDTLRDAAKNEKAAAVFGKMTEADITASVAKVLAIDDASIRAMVAEHGPGDEAARKALADTLIARKVDLFKRYPKAAKPGAKKPLDRSALPIDPKTIPKPHDFENWNGPGKGLSSKAAINQANAADEYAMLALAQAGNLTALKTFQFTQVNKDTGTPTGAKLPISQHPSKHVVQYHSDLVQLLDEVANPPEPLKVFRTTDVGTVAGLSAAFPPKPFGTTVSKVSSNEKLGFWVALGAITGVAKFAPKVAHDYSTAAIHAAKEKYKTASALAKHFISSVQASGTYNDLFRDGKTTDSAGNKLTDVAKAALAHATEMPEGTSLYRWQKMSPQMLAHIMSAKEGTVFQATGPMCTSYHPTATKNFGTHRVKIRYAKGAKAVESFASGGFASEKEVTTLPNARFVILSKQMVPDVEHGNPGAQRLELEILMLPPDLGIKA